MAALGREEEGRGAGEAEGDGEEEGEEGVEEGIKVERRVVMPRVGSRNSFLPRPYVGPTAGMLAAELDDRKTER